jgi:hypothetical protein
MTTIVTTTDGDFDIELIALVPMEFSVSSQKALNRISQTWDDITDSFYSVNIHPSMSQIYDDVAELDIDCLYESFQTLVPNGFVATLAIPHAITEGTVDGIDGEDALVAKAEDPRGMMSSAREIIAVYARDMDTLHTIIANVARTAQKNVQDIFEDCGNQDYILEYPKI